MSKSRIKCVIFDCEGTLVDSERLCCEALVQVFGELGVTLSYGQVAEHFSGGKIADILHSACELAQITTDMDLLEQRYRLSVAAMFRRKLLPMEGARALINYLKRNQIEFCVVSNAPREKIIMTLTLAGLESHFEGRVFSAFDANSWKPDPDLIHYCTMNMGFTLDECIYIDDTQQGVSAGVNAGVMTFQLRPLSLKNCSDSNQVTILSNLIELIDFLNEDSLRQSA